MPAIKSKTDFGHVLIRSNQSFLDGLTGKAHSTDCDSLVQLILSADASQADLEKGDKILIPYNAITLIKMLSKK